MPDKPYGADSGLTTPSISPDGKESDILISNPWDGHPASYSGSTEVPDPGDQTRTRCHRTTTLVELPLFVYLFTYKAAQLLKEQYVYSAVYEDVSGATNSSLAAGSAVDSLASRYLSIMNLVRDVPGLVCILLICALTDVTGRRLGLILPCLGGALKMLIFVLQLRYQLPIPVLYLGEFLEGVGGSQMTAQNVACLYLADVILRQEKTFRFSVLQAMYFLGTAFGSVCTGYMIDQIGFKYTFVALGAIYLFDIALILVFLRESNTDRRGCETFSALATFKEAVESFRVLCPRPSRKGAPLDDDDQSPLEKSWQVSDESDSLRLTILWLMLTAYFCDNFVLQGRNDVDVLYMISSPFYMDSVDLGYYQAAKYGCKFVSATLLIGLLGCCLSDAWIGVLASLSGLFGNLLMGLAYNRLMLWMVVLVAMLSGLVSPLASAMMSKYVPFHQQKALFACLGIVEGVGDLASGTLLDLLYSATVHVFSGTVYMVITAAYGLASFCFLAFILLRYCRQRQRRTN